MLLLNKLKIRAKNIQATIVLPEASLDKRVYNACKIILKEKLCNLVVFGKDNEFDDTFKTPNCTIIDIENYNKIEEFADCLYELRKHKGLSRERASELVKRPDYFACVLIKKGLADGIVAGALWSTADTLRPALQVVKTKPDKKIVTGIMLMVKDDKQYVFGDVSLIENPNSEELSEIAISSAEFMDKVIGIEPKVAMLSYSTKGSAESEMVDKVRIATELAQTKSHYLIDGEMQVDSALDLHTARKKGISTAVGGEANVLIFPDLNAGNIGYKLVSRLGGYTAIGPIMLNFNNPVNDLSRGCTVEEIVNTVVITKLLIE